MIAVFVEHAFFPVTFFAPFPFTIESVFASKVHSRSDICEHMFLFKINEHTFECNRYLR